MTLLASGSSVLFSADCVTLWSGFTLNEGLATLRILVVDDDRLVRAAMVRTLQSFPAVVVEDFSLGEDAIVRLDAASFDVAVLDLKMPTIDGVDLAVQLTKKLPALRIIFVSADLCGDIARRARALDPHALLPKPWPSGELARLIRS